MQALYQFIVDCLIATEILSRQEKGLARATIATTLRQTYLANAAPEIVEASVNLVTDVLKASGAVTERDGALWFVGPEHVVRDDISLN